jgi:transaldolase
VTATETRRPMAELAAVGQSVWLDYIRRDLLDGELEGLVEAGLRGMTSNPTIFEKAIGGTDLYDADIAEFVAGNPDASPVDIFEHLAIADIREATDQLRSVYDRSGGRDGFVSLEVSPDLARDTDGTVADARRLWSKVDRPNLMIKVPATAEGIPAIETLIGEGINVNVTLMFSMAHYEAVAGAFLRGLESCEDPSGVNSVASVFVSRIDTAVDDALADIGTDAAAALRGRIAVANAKAIYARSRELFGDDFVAEWGRGVGPQRPLWASTSTKNPDYPDLLYVEPLVGSDTVNTLPPATLDAFLDHGTVVADAVTDDLDAARAALAALDGVGVDLDAICNDLQVAGVDSFADSFRSMLDAIDTKRAGLTG